MPWIINKWYIIVIGILFTALMYNIMELDHANSTINKNKTMIQKQQDQILISKNKIEQLEKSLKTELELKESYKTLSERLTTDISLAQREALLRKDELNQNLLKHKEWADSPIPFKLKGQ